MSPASGEGGGAGPELGGPGWGGRAGPGLGWAQPDSPGRAFPSLGQADLAPRPDPGAARCARPARSSPQARCPGPPLPGSQGELLVRLAALSLPAYPTLTVGVFSQRG